MAKITNVLDMNRKREILVDPIILLDQLQIAKNDVEKNKGLNFGFGKKVHDLAKLTKKTIYIVHGHSSSGKTTFTENLFVNCAVNHNYKFLIASFEHDNLECAMNLLSKKYEKDFYELTSDQIEDGCSFLSEHFRFVIKDDWLGLHEFLSEAERWCADHENCAVVIDPFNELKSERKKNETETEYINYFLGCVRKFVNKTGKSFFVIAHPNRMPRDSQDQLKPPTPDRIMGSSHWWNKADVIMCIHRQQSENDDSLKLFVQKCRNKQSGRIGATTLYFDKQTGLINETSKFEESLDF